MNTITTGELDQAVEKKRNQLKSEKLDMSFSELMSMYQDEDLIISPEYQRAFRWSKEQQTRFIESVLLGIPTPPIFVAEDDEGKWELVDGLQRISTIFSFFGILDEKDKGTDLEAGSLIPELEGKRLQDLSIKLKNTIKRAFLRVEILRWDSSLDMRYELFNRLNTGGSPLSSQEVRNCVYRGEFNNMLKEIAKRKQFKEIINITEEKEKSMYGEELVLRFFALQKQGINISTSIKIYLNNFMKKIYNKRIEFEIEKEKEKIDKLLEFFKDIEQPFEAKFSGFSVGYWDVFLYFLSKYFDYYKNRKDEFQSKMEQFKKKYKDKNKQTNESKRMKQKIHLAEPIFTPKK